jgi:hypothetical protein
MKRKFIMMSIFIQGPKQSGNDIDVYLRPLIDDLKMLWVKEGVPMWDDVDSVYSYQTSFGLARGQVLRRIQETLLPSSVNPRNQIHGTNV